MRFLMNSSVLKCMQRGKRIDLSDGRVRVSALILLLLLLLLQMTKMAKQMNERLNILPRRCLHLDLVLAAAFGDGGGERGRGSSESPVFRVSIRFAVFALSSRT